MYFLAEASREHTVKGDQEIYDFFEDPIMMACSSVPLEGRICELTLDVNKDDNCEVPMFTINDLSKSAFAQLGPIAGPPYYRFYAGTPITTPKGVNIGSLAIMDTIPRPDLSASEVEFMGKTASQIMTYLETNRQAIEGRRARRLAEGLESFIAGKRSLRDDTANGVVRTPSRRKKIKAYGIAAAPNEEAFRGSLPTSPTKSSRPSALRAKTSLESIPSGTDSSEPTTDSEPETPKDLDMESRSHAKTFARAANLLRESFGDLGEDGAVVFMSLKSRLNKSSKAPVTEKHRHQSSPSTFQLKTGKTSPEDVRFTAPVQEAGMLASSTWDFPLAISEDAHVQPPKLAEDMLQLLMRRYPGGRLWSLDDTGRTSSSEDDIVNGNDRRHSEPSGPNSRRRKNEVKALRTAFPHARQVLFAPVWDSSVGSFQQAVFVVASSDTRSLSATTELSFLNSFCSTVMAECSRIDTMKADQMKVSCPPNLNRTSETG